MTRPPNVWYECTRQTFRPDTRYPVRWLDWDTDYALALAIWPATSP